MSEVNGSAADVEKTVLNTRKHNSRKLCLCVRAIAMALVCVGLLSSTGCMGMLTRHIEKGNLGNYATLQGSMPPVAAGMGRLVVYVKEGGPDAVSTVGAWDGCTVDDEGYMILGKTYWYLDLQAGPHKVTATGVKSGWTGLPARYGKKRIEFILEEGETKFCRMDVGGTKFAARFMTYTPIIVPGATAVTELATLDFYENFRTGMRIR